MPRYLKLLLWILPWLYTAVFFVGAWYAWNVSLVYGIFCLGMGMACVVEIEWLYVRQIRRRRQTGSQA